VGRGRGIPYQKALRFPRPFLQLPPCCKERRIFPRIPVPSCCLVPLSSNLTPPWSAPRTPVFARPVRPFSAPVFHKGMRCSCLASTCVDLEPQVLVTLLSYVFSFFMSLACISVRASTVLRGRVAPRRLERACSQHAGLGFFLFAFS